MSPTDDQLTITFPARLWAPIDATIDKSVSTAAVDGVESIVERGTRVREAGWTAMRDSPETNELGWPPADHLMPISARQSDWAFVLAQLDRWQPYDSEEDAWFYEPARKAIRAALSG